MAELKNFVQSEDVQQRLHLKTVNHLSGMADRTYFEETVSQEGFPEIQKDNLFKVFTYVHDESTFKFSGGLIPISKLRAPRLHAAIENLTEQLKLPHKPLICLNCDMSYAHYTALYCYGMNFFSSCIVLGYKLCEALSNDGAIKALLAHEASHIRNDYERYEREIKKQLEKNKWITRLRTWGWYGAVIAACIPCALQAWATGGCVSLMRILLGGGIIGLYKIVEKWLLCPKHNNPVLNQNDRVKGEAAADALALEITHDPDSFIAAMECVRSLSSAEQCEMGEKAQFIFRKLEVLEKMDKGRADIIRKNLNYLLDRTKKDPDHPSIEDRIKMAKNFKEHKKK
jgi:hypothetical protein